MYLLSETTTMSPNGTLSLYTPPYCLAHWWKLNLALRPSIWKVLPNTGIHLGPGRNLSRCLEILRHEIQTNRPARHRYSVPNVPMHAMSSMARFLIVSFKAQSFQSGHSQLESTHSLQLLASYQDLDVHYVPYMLAK